MLTTKTLYSYGCRSCKTIMVAPYESKGARCYRCNLCRSPMVFLWSEPAVTDEQIALWQKGPVFNPGQSQAPTPPVCDQCGGYASILYGVRIAGVGRFCSAKCADEAMAKANDTKVPQ